MILIKHNNEFMKYSSSEWVTVTTSQPLVADYLKGNTPQEISLITSEGWSQLSGEIEILYYTENLTKTEIQINMQTKPFSFYTELGDVIEVLHYTDNPNITAPILQIDAKYSPLDEIDGDFEIVTWTDKSPSTINEKLTSKYEKSTANGKVYSTEVDLTKGFGVSNIHI